MHAWEGEVREECLSLGGRTLAGEGRAEVSSHLWVRPRFKPLNLRSLVLSSYIRDIQITNEGQQHYATERGSGGCTRFCL